MPMSAQHPVPVTLEAAQALLALQQTEIDRLHTAHEAWMRAVAHDLRAPLRHVVSFAPLLKESVAELAALAGPAPQSREAAEDAHEFATTMEQSARKMSAMLDGLATLSRATRAPLHVDAVDWTALVLSLVTTLRAQHPNVQWELPHLPVWVAADAESLRSAMQAVLTNAVKFSARQGQPQVRVFALPLEQGGWRLSVQDNGVGFDDSRAQHLGELFQRMHRDSEFEGVGCGLALVSTIARRHGARWKLQSQPSSGCTISLDWPASNLSEKGL